MRIIHFYKPSLVFLARSGMLPLICTLQLDEWHCIGIGSMSRGKKKRCTLQDDKNYEKLHQAWGLDAIKLSQKDILLDIHSIYVEDTRCKSVFLGQGCLLNIIRRVNHVTPSYNSYTLLSPFCTPVQTETIVTHLHSSVQRGPHAPCDRESNGYS